MNYRQMIARFERAFLEAAHDRHATTPHFGLPEPNDIEPLIDDAVRAQDSIAERRARMLWWATTCAAECVADRGGLPMPPKPLLGPRGKGS